MYTVLIVDDEEPVLESYGYILDNGVPGFVLAGTARNGNEAVARIYDLKPDVVFMDINMPGLDGLEAIARVHNDFPHTIFILSTAYERFDIARRAIPLGVFAYLVKPVTRQVFLDTLAQVAVELGSRKKRDFNSENTLIEQKFLKETVWKKISKSDWEKYRRMLALDSDEGMICFIGIDGEQPAFFERINTALDLKYRFLFTEHLNLGMYFFPAVPNRGVVVDFVLRTIESCVPSSVVSLTGFGELRSYTELGCSCDEALAALYEKKNYTDIRLRERLRIVQLRRKMGVAESEEVRQLFADYWGEVFAAYDFATAKAKMILLFTLLVDDVTDYFQVHTEVIPPFFPAEEIAPLEDLSSWKDWALPAFNRIYTIAKRKRSGEFSIPLMRALSFVDENFEKEIQLSNVAENASVSPAYLSRLFSEQLGVSFVEYLTGLRIERAEQLIRENKMNIKEISFAVGYQDPNYFSKAFRKTVGMSPSMYAERSRYEKSCR
ncbi:MAG TPA: helix-turn-helix domain-containing protein [Treponema sp.]|nr:helix-turn-helix domain-containing protein [Treponema sp.]